MVVIRITKNGKILKDENFDNIFGLETKIQELDSVKSCLGCFLVIEDGTTFETFFNLIMKDKEYYDMVFCEQLHGISLNEFEKEWNKKSSKNKNDNIYNLIKFIEIEKYIDHVIYKEQNIKTIEIYNVINAIGIEDNNEIIINIGLISINDLKKFPLIINYTTEILSSEEEDDIDISGQVIITVGDAISAILSQITYYGVPKQRDKIRKEAIETYNNEDKIAFLKEKLKQAIEKENFELAEKLNKEIEDKKNN